MNASSSEVYGYIVSFEPVLRRNIVSYRVRVLSPGVKSWIVYLREIPKNFRLGVFAKIKVIVSKQAGEERLIAEELEVMVSHRPYPFVESIIEEVSKGAVTIVAGRRNDGFFSLPVTDEEILNRLPNEFPVRAMCLIIETGKGLNLASILSEKEYKVILRTIELLDEIDEYEERSNRQCREQLSTILHIPPTSPASPPALPST